MVRGWGGGGCTCFIPSCLHAYLMLICLFHQCFAKEPDFSISPERTNVFLSEMTLKVGSINS